jgi:hypothetical protein
MASVARLHRRQAVGEGSAGNVFISGLDHIEAIGGGMLRFVLYINIANEAGLLDAIPLDFDIVMPASALPDAIGKALSAMGRVVFAREGSLSVMQ